MLLILFQFTKNGSFLPLTKSFFVGLDSFLYLPMVFSQSPKGFQEIVESYWHAGETQYSLIFPIFQPTIYRFITFRKDSLNSIYCRLLFIPEMAYYIDVTTKLHNFMDNGQNSCKKDFQEQRKVSFYSFFFIEWNRLFLQQKSRDI